jgi:hypothetical protein
MHGIPQLDRKGLRDFGITTGALIAALFGLLFPWLLNLDFPIWPWLLFGLLTALGLIIPQALGPVYKGWMRFGLLLSRITTPLVLGIVFFGMVLPMGLIMRLGRRDPMARKFDRSLPSYRVTSNKPSRDNMERPF